MRENIKKLKLYFLLIGYLFLQFGNNVNSYFYAYAEDREISTNLNSKKDGLKIETSDDLLQKNFYLIGPGDLIEINLLDDPDISGEYMVLNDGTIPFPLIGSVYLNGLSIAQANKLIQEKYSNQLLRPQLYLTVKVPRPIKISVIGEVVRPGIYSLTKNENSNLQGGPQIINSGLPTIVDAIQKAGGITQDSNLSEVSIKRRLPGYRKKYKSTKIDLYSLIFEGDLDQNIYLFDGDIIELSKAPINSSKIINIAEANLSPQTINVSVVGQVNTPGNIKLKANTPLVQAIFSAGGPIDWRANKGSVKLIRINKNGTVTKRKFKINLKQDVSDKKNPPLKDRDIIYVTSSKLNSFSTGLGAVTEPISPIVTAVTLFKLLN